MLRCSKRMQKAKTIPKQPSLKINQKNHPRFELGTAMSEELTRKIAASKHQIATAWSAGA